jgi:tetratricopeptide (TPR) repeat protein
VLRLIGEDGSQAFAIQEMNCRGEDELLHRAIGTGQQMLVQSIYFCKLIHAYWLQNYDEVAMLSELYGEEHRMRFMDAYHIFYGGLAALHLAKRADAEKDKWVKIGEKAVSTTASWIDHSNWNFENKYLLLSAELQYVRGNYNAAGDCYNASIYSAKNHRFVHEEGLAFERLGMLYKEMGRTENALEMLKNASACYEKWGATAVVQRLRSHI